MKYVGKKDIFYKCPSPQSNLFTLGFVLFFSSRLGLNIVKTADGALPVLCLYGPHGLYPF